MGIICKARQEPFYGLNGVVSCLRLGSGCIYASSGDNRQPKEGNTSFLEGVIQLTGS